VAVAAVSGAHGVLRARNCWINSVLRAARVRMLWKWLRGGLLASTSSEEVLS
jgi:hypothetical protein